MSNRNKSIYRRLKKVRRDLPSGPLQGRAAILAQKYGIRDLPATINQADGHGHKSIVNDFMSDLGVA